MNSSVDDRGSTPQLSTRSPTYSPLPFVRSVLRLGPFILEFAIGRGGMAEVWSAKHAFTGVPAAVKVMTASGTRTATFRALFEQEAAAMAMLSHPNIARVYDYGEVQWDAAAASQGALPAGHPYIVMEFVEGLPLNEAPLPTTWDEFVATIDPLLDALVHAHARGVLHRDLKPANLLRTSNGHLKLIDFGVARLPDQPLPSERPKTVHGTPAYMAPEQVRGRVADEGPWSDLYAVGCIAYHFASGRRPFIGDTARDVMRMQARVQAEPLVPTFEAPSGLAAWIERLMQKAPWDRYWFAAEARDALRAMSPERPDVVHTEDRGTRRAPMLLTWEQPMLAGREKVTLTLRRALRHAIREQRTIAVVVRGADGSGKSRVVRWLAEQAHETAAAQTVHVQPIDGDDGWRTGLRTWLGITDASPEAILKRLNAVIDRHGATVEPWVRQAILRRVGAESTDATPVAAQSVDRGASTAADDAAAIVAFLQSMSVSYPILVELEDVHRSPLSIVVADLALRVKSTRRCPMLLVLTAATEALAHRADLAFEVDKLTQHEGCLSVELERVPIEALQSMLAEWTQLPQSTCHEIAALAEGNVAFSVDLVRDWARRGFIQYSNHGDASLDGRALNSLPTSARDHWIERLRVFCNRMVKWARALRLDVHPGDLSRALSLVGLMGQQLDFEEWEQAATVCGLEQTRPILDALVGARLAERSEVGLRVVHPALRHVLIDQATGGEQRDLHRAIAKALAGDPLAADRRAAHHLAAHDLGPALDELILAARTALCRGDTHKALAHLAERSAVETAVALPTDDPRHLDGLVESAYVLRFVPDRRTEAFEMASRAVAAAELRQEDTQRRVTAHLVLGSVALSLGKIDAAEQAYRSAIDCATTPYEFGRARVGLGFTLRRAGDLAGARDQLSGAREAYRAIDHDSGLASALRGLAEVALTDKDLPVAQLWLEEARELYHRIGDRNGVAACDNNFGEALRYSGKLEAAEAAYRRSIAAYNAVGSADVVFPQLNLAQIYLRRGLWEAAERVLLPLRMREGESWTWIRVIARCLSLPCYREHSDAQLREEAVALHAEFAALRIIEPDCAWAAATAAEYARSNDRPSAAEMLTSLAAAIGPRH